MDVIRYENVCKTYDNKSIIENFNLKIEENEFVTIIGNSGSGKTTILKMVNGLIPVTGGNIYVRQKNIKNENIIELRRSIGYAIQGSVLFPHLNVEENIGYVPKLLNKGNKEAIEASVSKWLRIVSLDDNLRKRYPYELSGGQAQRVGIARALAASPDILLMDEPFGAVDEITRKNLQREIKKIHEENNITILFVTHDVKEAITLGTKVLVLNNGVIHQYDTPENIMNNPKTDYVAELVNIQ